MLTGDPIELDLVSDRGQCVKRIFEKSPDDQIGYVTIRNDATGKFQCAGWNRFETAEFLEVVVAVEVLIYILYISLVPQPLRENANRSK